MESPNRPEALLVGTTADLYQGPSVVGRATTAISASQVPNLNYFKSAQWYRPRPLPFSFPLLIPSRSPDGTTILTSSALNTLRSFVLPPDLLSPPHPKQLEPYNTHTCPEPVCASTFHPSYALAEPSSCLFIASLRSLPIRLLSPFAPGILSSYPLISPTTEAYITPHSLLFNPNDTSRFFAGSDSCITRFDVNRNGEGPISTMRTTASCRNHNTAGQGMKGIISALTISSDRVLAAGTFNRWIGLYDGGGSGDTIAVFPLAAASEPEAEKGQGITQVLWSACSRYLCVAERRSDGVGVWDVRGTGKRLAWLRGRKANTQQRLGVEVMGGDVWAGGTDGVVRVWEGLGMKEGILDPTWQFQAHGDAVSSATLHPTGSVLATCSGQRHWSPPTDGDGVCGDLGSHAESVASSVSSARSYNSTSQTVPSNKLDNSLKLWVL